LVDPEDLAQHIAHFADGAVGPHAVQDGGHRIFAALSHSPELGEPLLSATLTDPSLDAPLLEPEELFVRYEKSIDLMLDIGACGLQPTTILDLTGPRPLLVREGRGDVARILDLDHG